MGCLMTLNMNMLICFVVAPHVVEASDRFHRTDQPWPVNRIHIPPLRLSMIASASSSQVVVPSRPPVVIHKRDLLARLVGPVDKATEKLSYAPSLAQHIPGPVNIGGYRRLRVVHHCGNVVHILGDQEQRQYMAPRRVCVESLAPSLTRTTTEERREVAHKIAFEDAVRTTIMAYARQHEALRQSSEQAPALQSEWF